MKYLVEVGDRTVEVDLRGDKPLVDGELLDARIEPVPGTQSFQLVIGDQVHPLGATRGAARGSWKIDLGSGPIEAEALDERTRAIRELAGDSETEQDKVIKAPMPGLVVRIAVAVGDAVTSGQGLVVVEAMKMENELKASGDGVVARIEVEPGQPVDKGAILVVLE